MKIGINLVGVSFDDGTYYRYRNFEDSIESFYEFVVNPLKEEGHDVYFYLCTYDSIKKNDILASYQPISNYVFLEKEGAHSTGMIPTYLHSLDQLKEETLDLVISTRYDIKFFKSPFKEYKFDYNKMNFLWREPELIHCPLVNDTFIVFPHKMVEAFQQAITLMYTDSHRSCTVAMHNLYTPMVQLVGENNVQWVDDEFKTIHDNNLYTLTRKE
jgi:hypothetical protein